MRQSFWILCLGAWLAWNAAACGGAAPKAAAAPKAPPELDALHYMPLNDNFVFAYETSSEDTAERGVLMIHVHKPREGMVELGTGNRIQRLEVKPDGIRHATGGYLLKSPLRPGQHWKGQFGDVSVITSNRAIQVAAGKFSACLETLEQATIPVPKKVRTVFCPNVGIVLLEAEGLANGSYTHESASLRSYGPAVDLNLGAPP